MVVFVAIGALWYFGVLNPRPQLPETNTTMPTSEVKEICLGYNFGNGRAVSYDTLSLLLEVQAMRMSMNTNKSITSYDLYQDIQVSESVVNLTMRTTGKRYSFPCVIKANVSVDNYKLNMTLSQLEVK